MTHTLNPMGNWLLVRLQPLPEATGLILRTSRNEAAMKADVLSVGPDVRDVTVGQVVLVSTLAGQVVGDELLIPESSILAFVE